VISTVLIDSVLIGTVLIWYYYICVQTLTTRLMKCFKYSKKEKVVNLITLLYTTNDRILPTNNNNSINKLKTVEDYLIQMLSSVLSIVIPVWLDFCSRKSGYHSL